MFTYNPERDVCKLKNEKREHVLSGLARNDDISLVNIQLKLLHLVFLFEYLLIALAVFRKSNLKKVALEVLKKSILNLHFA